MKNKSSLAIILSSIALLASCGGNTSETSESSVIDSSEESVVTSESGAISSTSQTFYTIIGFRASRFDADDSGNLVSKLQTPAAITISQGQGTTAPAANEDSVSVYSGNTIEVSAVASGYSFANPGVEHSNNITIATSVSELPFTVSGATATLSSGVVTLTFAEEGITTYTLTATADLTLSQIEIYLAY